MAIRRIAIICGVIALAALAGCGKKKPTQPDSAPSNPGPRAGGPSALGLGGKDEKKNATKPTYEMYIADMKTYAGKKKTDQTPSGYEALMLLAKHVPPTDEHRAEVYKALMETATTLPRPDGVQYAEWATKYVGPENALDLIAIAREYATDVKTSTPTNAAFDRLVELKEPSTFAPIAAMLDSKNGILALMSAKAIKAIGAPAEKAVQPYAGPTGKGGKPNDFLLRVKAIGLLGDIGTTDSVPLLQASAKDPNSTIASSATTAIMAIQARKK